MSGKGKAVEAVSHRTADETTRDEHHLGERKQTKEGEA